MSYSSYGAFDTTQFEKTVKLLATSNKLSCPPILAKIRILMFIAVYCIRLVSGRDVMNAQLYLWKNE